MKAVATRVGASVHIYRCFFIACVVAAGLVLGCGPSASIGEPPPASSQPTPGDTTKSPTSPTSSCPSITATYATVAPIFAHYCTSCHSSQLSGRSRNGAPPQVNYDTYADASADAELAVGAIRANMPPGLRLAIPDACAIAAWADEGAPE